MQTLIAAGNAVGSKPLFVVEGDVQRLNLFAALSDIISKGRMGTSWGRARYVITQVDPSWQARIKSGLSSGEGLIWEVRDPIEEWVKNKNDEAGTFDMEVTDPE